MDVAAGSFEMNVGIVGDKPAPAATAGGFFSFTMPEPAEFALRKSAWNADLALAFRRTRDSADLVQRRVGLHSVHVKRHLLLGRNRLLQARFWAVSRRNGVGYGTGLCGVQTRLLRPDSRGAGRIGIGSLPSALWKFRSRMVPKLSEGF